jgi:hypothetical protein
LGSYFAKQTLRRRLIALAAAYAIALAGLVGSFNVARAAAAESGGPAAPICHTLAGNQAAPSSGESNGKICTECCCAGCLMFVAALPPPADGVAAIAASGSRLPVPASAGLAAFQHDKSHRSRAPPLTA